jgi:hypothetical protein
MRTLCAATLIAETMVIGFAALVAMKLSDVPSGTLWAVTGAGMLLCVLLCAVVDRPWGVTVGWVLQAGLIATGFVVPMMFVVGAIFAGVWYAAVYCGRRIDAVKAAHAAKTV